MGNSWINGLRREIEKNDGTISFEDEAVESLLGNENFHHDLEIEVIDD